MTLPGSALMVAYGEREGSDGGRIDARYVDPHAAVRGADARRRRAVQPGDVGHHGGRVLAAALLHQPPGEPVDRRQPAVHQRALAPELAHPRLEQPPPLVAAPRDQQEVAV